MGDIVPGLVQNVGDATTLAALPVAMTGVGTPIAASMATIGGYISFAGTSLELVNDAFEGNLSAEKVITKGAIELLSHF